MIFEINKRYEIELVEQDGSRSFVRGVLQAFEGTLLTLQTDHGERTFNTSSLAFVSVQEWKAVDNPIYQPGKPPVGQMYLDDEPSV